MNGFVLLAVGVIIAAFGLWPVIYKWMKKVVPVPTTVDAEINAWLLTAKSTKVQALLRLSKLEFKARGDAASVTALDGLIALAATWDDVPAPKQPANIPVATTP